MNPLDVPPDVLRLPPQSPEAEASLLGGLMLSGDALESCGVHRVRRRLLQPGEQVGFEAVMALAGAGKPADVVTVFDWLQSAGKAADVRDRVPELASAVRAFGPQHAPLRRVSCASARCCVASSQPPMRLPPKPMTSGRCG